MLRAEVPRRFKSLSNHDGDGDGDGDGSESVFPLFHASSPAIIPTRGTICQMLVDVPKAVFKSSTKRHAREFDILVVLWRPGNVPESVMYVQNCCFSYKTCCFFMFPLPSL